VITSNKCIYTGDGRTSPKGQIAYPPILDTGGLNSNWAIDLKKIVPTEFLYTANKVGAHPFTLAFLINQRLRR
jgi:hypothetical protein